MTIKFRQFLQPLLAIAQLQVVSNLLKRPLEREMIYSLSRFGLIALNYLTQTSIKNGYF